MGLDRAVDHRLCHQRRHHLDCGDQVSGHLVAVLVHRVGGLERQQSGLFDLAVRARHVLADAALLGQFATEGGAVVDPAGHGLERALGLADRAHAVVDAPRAQPALGDLEALTCAEDDVGLGHANVLESQLGLAAGRVEAAEHLLVAHDGQARRAARHDHRAVLRMAGSVGQVATHHQQQLAALVHDAADPPLAAVEQVIVPVLVDSQRHVGGVRRGHLWFGHHVGRPDVAIEQRCQPLRLLGRRAVAGQYLHVAGVRRRAIEHLR